LAKEVSLWGVLRLCVWPSANLECPYVSEKVFASRMVLSDPHFMHVTTSGIFSSGLRAVVTQFRQNMMPHSLHFLRNLVFPHLKHTAGDDILGFFLLLQISNFSRELIRNRVRKQYLFLIYFCFGCPIVPKEKS
jgi:hypothetical protein